MNTGADARAATRGRVQPGVAVDGRSTRWDEHRAARRAELIRAASKAVHRGGPGVSMDEIAAASGTSKSIIYRYFDDKTGLQVALGSAVVGQMHDALTQAAESAETPKRALRAMVGVYLEMIESSPNVYYFVTRTSAVAGTEEPAAQLAASGITTGTAGASRAPLAAFLDSVIELVAEPFARVTDVSSADAAAWAAGAVGFVRGAGEWWLGHRDRVDVPDREQLTERVAAWLWAGPVGVLSHNPGTPRPHDDRRTAPVTRRDGVRRPTTDRPEHPATASELKEIP
ncbi:TetR/AcrR family transcriptional regulator [Cellulosimicrobium cellulans]|uniref:TetR/AcrR family transcriptional regulator n=1 Tax=Cellulosimicrobium cellulans TaxID=1710 RepID=UPI0024071C7E|nr:TetR/AcrR family transcriptional regulator [Cellulosimicrobium cellulans]MDF9875255.1 AcrR family transcriptional regulator [Cellulosimicrobium cellulans]